MKLGPAGENLIKSFEELRLDAYLPTPDDVPTIGWGHTRGVALGDTCDTDQAERWFVEDVAWAEDCVKRAVTVPLTQEEFDALVSLCFNIGCKHFSGSTLVKPAYVLEKRKAECLALLGLGPLDLAGFGLFRARSWRCVQHSPQHIVRLRVGIRFFRHAFRLWALRPASCASVASLL